MSLLYNYFLYNVLVIPWVYLLISSSCLFLKSHFHPWLFSAVTAKQLVVYWGSIVSIATGYGLDNRGVRVRVPVGSRIFSSPHHPYWFWGPPSCLASGYLGLFLWGVKLTTHHQLMPRSRQRGSIDPLPHMSSWYSA
jgi:hypothetical protein